MLQTLNKQCKIAVFPFRAAEGETENGNSGVGGGRGQKWPGEAQLRKRAAQMGRSQRWDSYLAISRCYTFTSHQTRGNMKRSSLLPPVFIEHLLRRRQWGCSNEPKSLLVSVLTEPTRQWGDRKYPRQQRSVSLHVVKGLNRML